MQELRAEMGLGDTLGALPIANGGTGSTSAADALSSLGCTIVDQVSDLTAADGYAISPAGVKAWFDQQSAMAISGSASATTSKGDREASVTLPVTLAGSNSNFSNTGSSVVINTAGTYTFNVSGICTVLGVGSSMTVECGYSVNGASYTVATGIGRFTMSHEPGTKFSGNDTRDIYVNAGASVTFWGRHEHESSGSAYARSSHTASFSITRKM